MAASEAFSTSARRFVGHWGFLGCVETSNPTLPENRQWPPQAARSLRRYVEARFASGLLRPSYTTSRDTTLPFKIGPLKGRKEPGTGPSRNATVAPSTEELPSRGLNIHLTRSRLTKYGSRAESPTCQLPLFAGNLSVRASPKTPERVEWVSGEPHAGLARISPWGTMNQPSGAADQVRHARLISCSSPRVAKPSRSA